MHTEWTMEVRKSGIGGAVRVMTMLVLLTIPTLGWGEPTGLSSTGVAMVQEDSASGTHQSAAAATSEPQPWFMQRLFNAYAEEFSPPPAESSSEPEPEIGRAHV